MSTCSSGRLFFVKLRSPRIVLAKHCTLGHWTHFLGRHKTMRITVVALTLIIVAFVCLEVPLAEGRIRIPRIRKPRAPRLPHRVPKAPKVHVPKPHHSGRGARALAGLSVAGVVGELGSSAANIAGTVMGAQQGKNEE
ncbi:uncharacterized protein LOC125946653 isoform X2 [Dermacentor silvarum]|uniref:uncharacterized protein LOC125946653 isoform X2 n=1 Tax=Dermacentor silvarum TaxID=543639 RepID=UPI0021006EB1|nr:uncharacterized protein LOC125946653 isoform X2 [Dermacentor silvarum]